jgi:dihydroorotase/N-acyl-D-amino-acid deacylase
MLRSTVTIALIATISLITFATHPAPAGTPFDLLITNGRLIDGAGDPWFIADLGIRNGRIAALGHLAGAPAKESIDASDLYVAPGFIDMHAHSEADLLANGGCCSKIYEGITTEVLGETSAAPAAGPLEGAALAEEREQFARRGVTVDWTTIGGYLDRLDRRGARLNALTYATFGAIRASAIGMADRTPTADELRHEEALMDQAMRDGAFGLATGLLYTPDQFSQTPEIVAVAKVAAQYGGIYASHIRDLTDTSNKGLKEAIEIGREAHIPVHIFHMQVEKQEGPQAATNALRVIQEARDAGLDVTGDMYPYTAASNPISSMIPPQYLAGGSEALVHRLQDPATRPLLVAGIAQSARLLGTPDDPDGWKEEFVGTVARPEDKKYVGKTFYEMGQMDALPPAESVANLLIREGGIGWRVFFNKTEESVREVIKMPWISIGGDAEDYDIGQNNGFANPHPRNFGAHTRILGPWVREGVFPLEEAVRKMTSLAAATLRLPDRGLLRPGMAADIVVFDPARVQDRATYQNPWQYSTGMADVIVNGVPVIRDGQLTAARPGHSLRGPAYHR